MKIVEAEQPLLLFSINKISAQEIFLIPEGNFDKKKTEATGTQLKTEKKQ